MTTTMKTVIVGVATAALGAVVIGLGGWMFNRIIEHQNRLTTAETTLSEIKARLDRMGSSMTSLGIEIAQEEVTRPIREAVVASAPTRTAKGWISAVHVFDVPRKQVQTFSIDVKGPDDTSVQQILSGIAWQKHPRSANEGMSTDLTRVSG